jgi:hypothetical protein
LTLIPKGWTKADLWQKGTPAIGTEVGTQSLEVDYNIADDGFYESEYGEVTQPPPPPAAIEDGYSKVRRFNSDVHIAKLPTFTRAHVTNTGGKLVKLSTIAQGADWGINLDGWPASGTLQPLSLAASDGNLYQPTQYDFRPFININASGGIAIGDNRSLVTPYNLGSAIRYNVRNGVNHFANSTNPEHITERHPRTSVGHTATGKLIMCVVDGRSTESAGVTSKELGDIMIEAGAAFALELDGGGSSAMWDGERIVNIPSDGTERPVINHLLVWTNGGSMTNGEAQEKLGNVAKVRTSPSRYAIDVYTIPAGGKTDFVEKVPVIKQGTADKDGEIWLKLPDGNFVNYVLRNSAGLLVEYFKILREPSEDPAPPPSDEIVDVPYKITLGDVEPITHEGTVKVRKQGV